MNIIIYITNLDCIFRIFGGLVADIKRKLPWYKSDFTDALHIQCVASFVYLFLATLTPNVTFGGLLTEATDEYMVCIFFIFPVFVGRCCRDCMVAGYTIPVWQFLSPLKL
jgi:hypothetical protein